MNWMIRVTGGAKEAWLWLPYDVATDAMIQLDETQAVINGYHNPQCDYFFDSPALAELSVRLTAPENFATIANREVRPQRFILPAPV